MADRITIDKIMIKEVITGTKEESVQSLAFRMKQHNIGVLVITNKRGKIDGLLTERDILCRVVCEGKNPAQTKAQEVMTKKVITGKPSMSDVEVAALFTKQRVKKLPIVKGSKLVGIVTQTDLLKLLSFKWAL